MSEHACSTNIRDGSIEELFHEPSPLVTGIPCYDPANLETVEIASRCPVKVGVSKQFLDANLQKSEQQAISEVPLEEKEKPSEIIESLDFSQLQTDDHHFQLPLAREAISVKGFVVMDDSSRIKVIHPDEVSAELGITEHLVRFSCLCPIYPAPNSDEDKVTQEKAPLPVDLNASEDVAQATPVDTEVGVSATSY